MQVGAEEVTRARKGCLREKLQKRLARGRIGDYLLAFSPAKSWFLTIRIAAFRRAGTRTATLG